MQFELKASSYAVLAQIGETLYGSSPADRHSDSKFRYDRAVWESAKALGENPFFILVKRGKSLRFVEFFSSGADIVAVSVVDVLSPSRGAISIAYQHLQGLVQKVLRSGGTERILLKDALQYVVNVARPLLDAIAVCTLPHAAIKRLVSMVFRQADYITTRRRHVPEEKMLKILIRLLQRTEIVSNAA